ncbi:LLM class flavin-dependent oxidoreductase [Oceanicola sp. S124]|uniref:LLM class flavin-dependent oxidoreductase n=1 Tax=Oceanicola sp. S124 TaxID=1042378 RepID=UPI0002557A1C|nr:LLM class flavin-dependent oxidoreductase [Oceanicola sp. S124]
MTDLPNRLRFDVAGLARGGAHGDHAALMRVVEQADAAGFGGIWFNEFHFHRQTLPYPHTLLLGAEILARTTRLRFGTSILVLPLHHPLMLAEQIAQLDFQSGGRVDVGIGRGTEPATFDVLGIDRDSARARFDEALAILLRVWTEPRLASDGPCWPFPETEVGPPPVQRPHPPIYVAGVSEETVALAARHGFPLLLSLEPNEARQIPVFHAALRRVGAGMAPMAASSLSRYVICAPRTELAEAALDRLTGVLNARRAARAAARGQPAPAPRDRAEMLADYTIAGTPEACRAQIAALIARTGCANLRCLFDANGLIPLPEAAASMMLFGTEVLPAFADLPLPPVPYPVPERT